MASKPKPSKPTVYAVRFTKVQFMSLASDERELLIRVGLALNDMLLFQRLWGVMSFRNPATQLAKEAHGVQSIALLLTLVGKLFEACEVFDKRFLSRRLAREYLGQFNKSQSEAVAFLKTLRGTGNLLAKIRNGFSFHYHADELSVFIEKMKDNRVLSLYLGDPDGNSLNAFAAEPFFHSLLKITGKKTPRSALRRIQNEAATAIAAFNSFAAGLQVVALKKMLGNAPRPEVCLIGDDEYLPHDLFAIPVFMGRPVGQRWRAKKRRRPEGRRPQGRIK